MSDSYYFKPKARLLLQLGDQLIRNEGIALLELLKNSYDADATMVRTTFTNLTDIASGSITVEDNGTGMDMETIEKVWLEPGTDSKTSKKITPIFKRPLLGEKGIGRFAAHKLGNRISLISKRRGSKEVHLNIDWKKFDTSEYMDKIKIDLEEKESDEVFKESSGTLIKIQDVREGWTRGKFRDSYRSWISLSSPFDFNQDFKTDFEIDDEDWTRDLLTLDDVEQYALFKFKAEIEGNKIVKFLYEFKPWSTMTKLHGRTITEKDFPIKNSRIISYDEHGKDPVQLEENNIKKFKIEGMVFDRDSKIMSFGVHDKQGFKQYLDENGGVRVYRDGIRVFDYGEKGNDWLSLDLKRINFPGERISNNIILAAVSLEKENTVGLIEKTNREGFIENKSYDVFVDAIDFIVELVGLCRSPDKERLREVYGPTKKSEPVMASIDEIRTTVESQIQDQQVKEKLLNTLIRLEKEYANTNSILLKSAAAGLTFVKVVHQIQKIVKTLVDTINTDPNSKDIAPLVKNLSSVIDGYLFLVRKTSIKTNSLKKLIDIALNESSIRFKVHNISIVDDFRLFLEDDLVMCADSMTVASIINILDNSIYWLGQSGRTDKKISISISDEMPDYRCLIISDNGTGFTVPVENVTKPYFSGKMFGTGIGLYVVNGVMESQKGLLIIPDRSEFHIPKGFEEGATVVLAFKKGEK